MASSVAATKMSGLPALRRQHLLAEFAGLKQACPSGVFVSLTPGDPSLWSGVLFVRKGPYATAILRFQVSFPDTFPALPPLVTVSTDLFHPLITPLTTYMYTTDLPAGPAGTVSASDDERLPPGGFSLRHGFPGWFGRRSQTTPHTSPGSVSSRVAAPGPREVSVYEVLRYFKSTFDDETVLDQIPLEAAGNPGAWHAWRTRQGLVGGGGSGLPPDPPPKEGGGATTTTTTARKPGEWNWEGVWEERVKRGIQASLSEAVLYGGVGGADEVINFLSMDDAEVEGVKRNLLRTLGVEV